MKTSKKLTRAVAELNSVIHSRNLYRDGHRYIDAHVSSNGSALMVTSLDSFEPVLFLNDGSFVDCNNRPVTVGGAA